MIYIINGEEPAFIERKINELIKGYEEEIIKYDGSSISFNIQELVDSCASGSLFTEKNFILVKDPFFLIKKSDDKELKPILDYINNPFFETELVFYTLENKFNSKLKIFKEILKNAQLCTFDSYDYKNFNTFVNQQININRLNIENDAKYFLANMCKRNATLLLSNIEVLKLYPEKITLNVVEKLCTVSNDNDSFELINALTNKDLTKAISIERKMINENDSVISVIGLLASQLRFLYQLAYLLSIGKNKNDVLDETKCSEARYNKSLETLRRINMKQILDLLSQLSQIDIQSKNDNSLSDKSRFELFILNMMKS